jgi:hypothetical protein
MRTLALCLALAGAASAAAQPALVAEATVDQEAYAYGETIALQYTLSNQGTEPAVLWEECFSPEFTLDSFTSPGDNPLCTPMTQRREIAIGGAVTWVWLVDPKELSVPGDDGLQTITGRTEARCGPDISTAPPYQFEASATFTAPRYVGGALRVRYAPVDADSVAALKAVYQATVADSSRSRFDGAVRERWLIEGTPLLDAVAALDENGVIEEALADRFVTPERVTSGQSRPSSVAVAQPTPNPTATTAAFTVRLATPEAVTVDLVDALGRRVAVLHDGPLSAGADHRFVLSAAGYPAGVYIVRVLGETVRQSHRVTVAR